MNQCDCNPLGTTGCDPVTGCQCIPGWTGVNCQEDIDECSAATIDCPQGAVCLNFPGSYICNCREGYQKKQDNSTGAEYCEGGEMLMNKIIN